MYFHSCVLLISLSICDKYLLINHTSLWINRLAVFFLLLIVLQVAIGTGVREEIDIIASSGNLPDRGDWLDQVSQVFELHRSLAWASSIAIVALFFVVRSRFAANTHQSRFTNLLLMLLVLQLDRKSVV